MEQISNARKEPFTADEIEDGTAAQTFANAYGYLELQVRATRAGKKKEQHVQRKHYSKGGAPCCCVRWS